VCSVLTIKQLAVCSVLIKQYPKTKCFTERTGPCLALIRYLPTVNNRKMRRNNREVESILREIIGKRIQAMERGEGTKDDLVGLLLETNMRDDMGMTIEDVIEECKVFYFAGMETMSVLLRGRWWCSACTRSGRTARGRR
jgi:cytochrome P450